MIVVQGPLQIEFQVVSISQRQQRLAVLRIDRQTLLVALNGRIHVFQLPVAMRRVEQDRLVGRRVSRFMAQAEGYGQVVLRLGVVLLLVEDHAHLIVD